MEWRVLLLVVILLVGGPAFSASSEVWRDAVKGAVQGMTLDEIIRWSDSQFRRKATVGRYVRWGGTIVLGSALIYTALDWFYGHLRSQTGTSLDQWWFWQTPYLAVGACRSMSGYSDFRLYLWQISGTTRTQIGTNSYSLYVECTSAEIESRVRAFVNANLSRIPEPFRSARWVSVSPPAGYCPSGFSICVAIAPDVQRPDLPTWLQQHPDAVPAVRDVVSRYVDSTPIASPSSPYPGVQLDPIPNPNQWTDNPFTRPDIDTDGDGYPDSVEWQEANRRGVPWPDLINNPDAYPDPHADPDGDGYTTGEEISLGTNPYDPASVPARRARPGPRTDTDGDGWPDEDEIGRGTDPRDPNSKPVGTPPLQDTDGDGVPDVEEIDRGTDPTNPEDKPEEEEEWPGGPPPGELRPVELPQVPSEEKKDLPQDLIQRLGQQWSEQVVQRVRERLRELQETARQRFPFALISALRVHIGAGSASCSWPVPIGPFTGQVNVCDTPFWQVAVSFRPVLEGLLWVAVALAIIRRGLDVQQ